MSSGKQYAFGAALVVLGIRLALVCLRASSPPAHAFAQPTPEEISQRETQRGERLAELARALDASVSDLEDREKLSRARGDATRALHSLGSEASGGGAPALGFEAFELERALLLDAKKTCATDALKKLDAASSAMTPSARATFAERLAIVHRHVNTACEVATGGARRARPGAG